MPALVAVQRNPHVQAFYEHFTEQVSSDGGSSAAARAPVQRLPDGLPANGTLLFDTTMGP